MSNNNNRQTWQEMQMRSRARLLVQSLLPKAGVVCPCCSLALLTHHIVASIYFRSCTLSARSPPHQPMPDKACSLVSLVHTHTCACPRTRRDWRFFPCSVRCIVIGGRVRGLQPQRTAQWVYVHLHGQHMSEERTHGWTVLGW